MEVDIELLHAIIDGFHLVITHHPDVNISRVKGEKGGRRRREESNRKAWKNLQFHQIHFASLAGRRHGFGFGFGFERKRVRERRDIVIGREMRFPTRKSGSDTEVVIQALSLLHL